MERYLQETIEPLPAKKGELDEYEVTHGVRVRLRELVQHLRHRHVFALRRQREDYLQIESGLVFLHGFVRLVLRVEEGFAAESVGDGCMEDCAERHEAVQVPALSADTDEAPRC